MILLGKFKFPASVYQWDVTLFRLGLIIDPHDKLLSLRRWSRDAVQRGCDIVCDVIILGQTAARVVIQVLHGAGLDWSYSISPHTEEPIRFLPCFYCFCHLQERPLVARWLFRRWLSLKAIVVFGAVDTGTHLSDVQSESEATTRRWFKFTLQTSDFMSFLTAQTTKTLSTLLLDGLEDLNFG